MGTYVRPQLSRKRTFDRELLEREQKKEISLHEETLNEGTEYVLFSEKLDELLHRLEDTDNLSEEDKKSIIKEIKQTFISLEKEYSSKIQSQLTLLEESMQERISEMEEAQKHWEEASSEIETIDNESGAVDIEKVRFFARELLRKYRNLLADSKKQLQEQIKKSEEQRIALRKNIYGR